jgi:hypothetical protein
VSNGQELNTGTEAEEDEDVLFVFLPPFRLRQLLRQVSSLLEPLLESLDGLIVMPDDVNPADRGGAVP